MNNFTIIYKILKAIESSMDFEEFNEDLISPETLGISKERRDKLLIEMQKEGYISGITVKQYIRQPAFISEPVTPNITIKGLEYLANNSMMKKAAEALKGIVEVIT